MDLILKLTLRHLLILPLTLLVMTFSGAALAQTTSAAIGHIAAQVITTLLLSDCGPRNQAVLDADVLIQSQSDVDALSSIAILDGDLTITSSSNLNFSPLDGLVDVTGTLRLAGNPAQTRFNGFNCLVNLGDLLVYRNPALEEIVGFNKLETIGHLEITNQDTTTTAQLRSLSGFTSLKTIDGNLHFYRMPFLGALPYFSALETIGASLDINRITSITDVPGFVNLVSVGRDLIIRRNNKLVRITGFDRLSNSNVIRNIEVYSNSVLDCGKPAPGFLPTTRSDGNLVDC